MFPDPIRGPDAAPDGATNGRLRQAAPQRRSARAVVEPFLSSGPNVTLDDIVHARRAGRGAGESDYAKLVIDDSIHKALDVLATCFRRDGIGTLTTEDHFHREIVLHIHLDHPHATLLPHFVAGVLEGFLGAAFNTAPRVEITNDKFNVWLGEGHDINARGAA